MNFHFHNSLSLCFFPRAHTRVRTGSLAITRSVKNSWTQTTRNPGRWSGRIITRLRTCTRALSGCPTMTKNPYVSSLISLINTDWPESWLGRLIPMTSVENAAVLPTLCCGLSTTPSMKKKTDTVRRPAGHSRWFLCKSWLRYSSWVPTQESGDVYYDSVIFSDKIFSKTTNIIIHLEAAPSPRGPIFSYLRRVCMCTCFYVFARSRTIIVFFVPKCLLFFEYYWVQKKKWNVFYFLCYRSYISRSI